MHIRVRYDGQAAGEPVTVALGLYRADGTHVASINSGATTRGVAHEGRVEGPDSTAGMIDLDYVVPALPVQPGTYELSVALHDANMRKVLERHTHILRFEVTSTGVDPQNGLVALGGTWEAR